MGKTNGSLTIWMLLVLWCAGCATRSSTLSGAGAEQRDMPYSIGSEDVLEIAVWQNEDLSRTVVVRPDGKISLPLIHDVQAAGLTPDDLKKSIAERLRPFMDTPNVTVIVQQINSWRVFVQGEVRSPGVYPIKSRTTVLQAIAMAGGFTEFAKKNKIRIVRRQGDTVDTLHMKYSAIISGKDPGGDPYLKPGDTVIVP